MDQSSSGKHLRTLQGPGVIEDVTYELKTIATCHTDARWSSKLEEMGCRHIWTPQHRLNGLLCWVLQWENAKKLWNDCVTSLLLLAYNCLTAWKLKAPTASDINGLEKPRISYLTTGCPRSRSSRVCNTLTTENGNSTEVFPMTYTAFATPWKHQPMSWLWQLLPMHKIKRVLLERDIVCFPRRGGAKVSFLAETETPPETMGKTH